MTLVNVELDLEGELVQWLDEKAKAKGCSSERLIVEILEHRIYYEEHGERMSDEALHVKLKEYDEALQMTTDKTPKEMMLALVKQFPEDVTWEDVADCVCLLALIDKGSVDDIEGMYEALKKGQEIDIELLMTKGAHYRERYAHPLMKRAAQTGES